MKEHLTDSYGDHIACVFNREKKMFFHTERWGIELRMLNTYRYASDHGWVWNDDLNHSEEEMIKDGYRKVSLRQAILSGLDYRVEMPDGSFEYPIPR